MVDNAIITLNSKQNDEEEIKVVTPGVFYEEEGVFHAKYEETEVSGMEGTTTILKIEKEKFSLIRENFSFSIFKIVVVPSIPETSVSSYFAWNTPSSS